MLHPDWKKLLTHSYVVWCGYFLIFLNAVDASYWFFIGYAPIPQWAMGLISGLIGVAIPYLRVKLQKSISGDPNAGE
ncbi:hypothetical protein EVC20_064 [Rhizobium phage RHph_Y2_17_1]|nr:hypothetical protein EVC19_064 [Rhizobium phage RHph_Y2_11]QIG75803.1 hypothetical protein EVC20_064 [Rhizobium phage RHph_Y2_17_1]